MIAAAFVLFARIGHSGNYLTEVLPAVVVFGFGLAINVAPLTSTVLAAAPAENAGAASAINNDVARAASLIAVAVLPAAAGLTGAAYMHPDTFSAGFRMASFISAGPVRARRRPCRVHDPQSAPGRDASRPAAPERAVLHCGLDCPPPRTDQTVTQSVT